MTFWNVYNYKGYYVGNYAAVSSSNALAKYYRDFPGSPRTCYAEKR